MTNNFYLGNEEYMIIPFKSIYAVINTKDYESRGCVEFTGNYDECLYMKEEMLCEHEYNKLT